MAGVIYQYWGKADVDYPGEPKWHPLVWHSLDVAAVGLAWLESSSSLRAAFQTAFLTEPGTATQPIQSWLSFFIALHDLGKFDIRFQLKAPEALAACWPDFDFDGADARQAKGYDHGKFGLAWGFSECTTWANASGYDHADAWKPWLQAVTGHHGEWLQPIPEPTWPEADDELIKHDRLARLEFVQSLADLFLASHGLTLADLPPPCSTAAQHLLAGFCSVCDWIGSNTEVSPYTAPTATLNNYLDARVRDIAAQGWLSRFGLLRSTQPYAGLEALLHMGDAPRGVQTRVQDLPLQAGLTLIEAPTGSGKTEAALAYAWRLLAAGRADAIVFALPTQATANAMLQRAEAFAERAFAQGGASVVLAHGKSQFNEAFQHLLAGNRTHTAQGSQEAGAQCTAWLAQSRKRVFLGQIGVCTVDQVLLSVLPVRHKFVRGFGLNKAVLIVDEVHAYDAYMYGLLEEVLRRQRASGGSAILLSATLPSTARNALLAAWGAANETVTDYPALWCATTQQANAAPALATLTPLTVSEAHRPPQRTVGIERLRLPDALPDDELLARIIAAAETGARVAVILNLVDAAQATTRRLRELTGLPVDLFHARYRFLDRREKEAAVLSHYGRKAVRDGGRILVATQVVEQSLDLDFDWMVTQICPVDLLFQRLGRLHRHEWRKDRPPGFTNPACTVMTVAGDDYGVFELIYGNARVLWRTDQLLASHDTLLFPTIYREWIERVYVEAANDDEPDAVIASYCAWKEMQKQAEHDAWRLISLPVLRQFSDENPDITIKTRDGEMSLQVLPVQDDGRLLDGVDLATQEEREQAETLSLNLVPVPASWRNFLRDSGLSMDESGHFPLRLRAQGVAHVVNLKGGKILRYTSEFGLERLDAPAGDPAGESPTGVGN